MKQRIEYFDLLKGIAIFLVVMGHALTMCIRGIDAAFLFKLIGQVHMPIFFFISGFLTYKDTFAPPALKKRFLQLISQCTVDMVFPPQFTRLAYVVEPHGNVLQLLERRILVYTMPL